MIPIEQFLFNVYCPIHSVVVDIEPASWDFHELERSATAALQVDRNGFRCPVSDQEVSTDSCVEAWMIVTSEVLDQAVLAELDDTETPIDDGEDKVKASNFAAQVEAAYAAPVRLLLPEAAFQAKAVTVYQVRDSVVIEFKPRPE